MEAVIIIGILVALFIEILAACEFRNIAEMKGHDGSKYFWYCFFFSVAGWVMVAALPDRSNKPAAPNANGTTAARPAPARPAEAAPSEELPDL